eukprot:jgi/Bigna1/62665/fgenesh1_kg.39_\
MIVFEEHTDSTFITVGPCSRVPGLQIKDLHRQQQQQGAGECRNHSPRWISAEKLANSENDVIVFAGEILQVLTKRRFLAARHRVIIDSDLKPPPASWGGGTATSPVGTKRLSFPLLMRGRMDVLVNTARYAPKKISPPAVTSTKSDSKTECGEESQNPSDSEDSPILKVSGLPMSKVHMLLL